jgi:elongation factor Ts
VVVEAALVKELREKTGAGIMDCKQALAQAGGDLQKAVDYLRQKGLSVAAKKSGRTTAEGIVGSYIHMGGKIGVLVEVNCETDFVAKTPEFQALVKDLAMQIAGITPPPLFITREEVPKELLDKERQIYAHQARESGKPENVIEKIVAGKLERFCSEVCLLEQSFIKDQELTIKDLLTQKIAVFGENIAIKRFVRFQMGEKT